MNKRKIFASIIIICVFGLNCRYETLALSNNRNQANIKIEVTSPKKINDSLELKFIKSNINELMRILFKEKDNKLRLDKLTKFVHTAFDTKAMGKYALSGIYRLQKQSPECMKRLEEKVVKYLCKIYSDATKDYENVGEIHIDISNIIEAQTTSIARGNVKFDGKDWPISINFRTQIDKNQNKRKPFNMVFNNVSVINPSAFAALFLEMKKDINAFEARLDKIINQ